MCIWMVFVGVYVVRDAVICVNLDDENKNRGAFNAPCKNLGDVEAADAIVRM